MFIILYRSNLPGMPAQNGGQGFMTLQGPGPSATIFDVPAHKLSKKLLFLRRLCSRCFQPGLPAGFPRLPDVVGFRHYIISACRIYSNRHIAIPVSAAVFIFPCRIFPLGVLSVECRSRKQILYKQGFPFRSRVFCLR